MIEIIRRSKKETKEDKKVYKLMNDLGATEIPKEYIELSKCPEVYAAVNRIADLISNMTLYLMENGENGDVRVVNGLSRLVDIEPSRHMTGKQWMQALVRCLLLEGDGNAVVKPKYKDGFIEELLIVPADIFSINPGKDFEDSYTITIGNKKYDPEDLIHFVLNPKPSCPYKGESFRIQAKDLADGLAKSRNIEGKFMDGRYMPSLLVKVDSDEEDVLTQEGRKKLTDRFIKTEPGDPMFIPADMLEVTKIEPMSLKDLAINESASSYKKTIAGLLGVPAFFIGEGSFNRDEYNTFIDEKIQSIAKVIEQTLTKQLLTNPNWYFKFNIRSLKSYDYETLANISAGLYDKGIMTGNEVRDSVDLSPRDELNELRILENYIPIDKTGDQKKLNDAGEEENEEETNDENNA